jgi:hypothetical protein
MKAFSDDKSRDRQLLRLNATPVPEKSNEELQLPPWNPEELHQTQAFIQELDKHFTELRDTLQRRQVRIDQVKRTLSALRILLFPSRRSWWRRWFPW